MAMTPSTEERPFLLAATTCAMAAVLGFAWCYITPHVSDANRIAVLGSGVVLLLAAVWLCIWPARTRILTAPLVELPIVLQDVNGQLTDLQAIRKEYHKVRTDIEGFASQTNAALKTLAETQSKGLASLDARQKAFDQAALDLQKADREKMELRQARGDADRRTEAWQKACVQFVRVLERTADPESGLSEGYVKAASKLANDFGRTLGPLGFQLIRPVPGDAFDDRVHEIAAEIETDTVPAGTVAACTEWGYLLREVATCKAKVALASAPRNATRESVARQPELAR